MTFQLSSTRVAVFTKHYYLRVLLAAHILHNLINIFFLFMMLYIVSLNIDLKSNSQMNTVILKKTVIKIHMYVHTKY